MNTDAQVCLELAILPDTNVTQLHPEMGLLFIRRRALAPRQSGERRRQVTKRKQVAWHGNVLSGEAWVRWVWVDPHHGNQQVQQSHGKKNKINPSMLFLVGWFFWPIHSHTARI